MAKATKSRSAKSKRAAAKPKRAAAKSKRAAAKPKRAAAKHKRKAGASLPVVRLVTPAAPTDKKHPSQDAFEKLLKKLLGSSVNYAVCYGKYDVPTLTQAANDAVTAAYTAVEAGQPAVIVAAGTMAATILQDITINQGLTTTIPIIQAVGGSVPTNRQPNLTGFIIDAAGTAQAQLAALNAPVAVLYDDTPGNPSNNIYGLLNQTKVTALTAKTPDDLAKVTLPAGTNGFMLLPNAMFYNHCDDVVKIVDGKTVAGGGPLPIYYPEREYKLAHKNKSGVKVLGHHVALTYRLAATYVDSILNGDLQIPLPELAGAIPDQF